MDNGIMPQVKVCKKCGAALEATRENFSPHKLGAGGLHPWCRPCKRADDAARRARPDQAERQQRWRDQNRDRVRQYNLAYREAGYKSTEHVKAWVGDKYRTDPEYNLKVKVRSALKTMVARCGIEHSGSRSKYLPFTSGELRLHLERQFFGGMSWRDVLDGRVHIDHVVPISAFKIKAVGDAEFMACWSLPNLRPIWATDNLQKGRKMEFLV